MDARDVTILKELDKNSRIPYQQIAKKINLSKDTVNYRIENMKKIGIIKGFHASINVGKLGYIGMRLLLKLYQVSPEKEQEIIQYLLDEQDLGWIVSVEGYWDINTYFYFKDINQMHIFYQNFIDKYSNYIEDKNFSIYYQVKAYSRDYLDKQLERQSFIIYENSDPIEIDEKDTIILSLLGEDARTTIRSHDEGIDGTIKEDKLGLDVICIQAKRWKSGNVVGRPELHKFVGALAGQGAKKGIFITASNFTKEAKDYIPKNESKIILIDGEQLVQLMIDYSIGCTILHTYELQKIDNSYFDEE